MPKKNKKTIATRREFFNNFAEHEVVPEAVLAIQKGILLNMESSGFAKYDIPMNRTQNIIRKQYGR